MFRVEGLRLRACGLSFRVSGLGLRANRASNMKIGTAQIEDRLCLISLNPKPQNVRYGTPCSAIELSEATKDSSCDVSSSGLKFRVKVFRALGLRAWRRSGLGTYWLRGTTPPDSPYTIRYSTNTHQDHTAMAKMYSKLLF